MALAASPSVAGIGSVFAQSDSAKSQLQNAANAFAQAFAAVSDAQKAGANVTSLVNQLNSAGSSLSQADMSYARGDFNGTIAAAAATILATQSIVPQAQNLKSSAQASGHDAALSSVAFSIIGVAVFLTVLFLVWRYVKNSYMRSILDARPEVVEG